MPARTGAMPPRSAMLRSSIRAVPLHTAPHTADRTAVPVIAGRESRRSAICPSGAASVNLAGMRREPRQPQMKQRETPRKVQLPDATALDGVM